MSYGAEVYIQASFINAQEAVPERTTLIEMGHPQPPTKIQVDNTRADAFFNKNLKQKRFKSIDMPSYWIQDIFTQRQFKYSWRPVSTNLCNYHTKHHSPDFHRLIRHKYLHTENSINQMKLCLLWGCVNFPVRAYSRMPVNYHMRVHSCVLVHYPMRAHSCLPENILQKPHSNIRMVRNKYGPLRY